MPCIQPTHAVRNNVDFFGTEFDEEPPDFAFQRARANVDAAGPLHVRMADDETVSLQVRTDISKVVQSVVAVLVVNLEEAIRKRVEPGNTAREDNRIGLGQGNSPPLQSGVRVRREHRNPLRIRVQRTDRKQEKATNKWWPFRIRFGFTI